MVTLPAQKPCDHAYVLRIEGLDLAGSKPAPPPGPLPTALVKPSADGTLVLLASDAQLDGSLRVQDGSQKNIGFWNDLWTRRPGSSVLKCPVAMPSQCRSPWTWERRRSTLCLCTAIGSHHGAGIRRLGHIRDCAREPACDHSGWRPGSDAAALVICNLAPAETWLPSLSPGCRTDPVAGTVEAGRGRPALSCIVRAVVGAVA